MTELHAQYYGGLWELSPRFEVDIAEGIVEVAGRYDSSRDGIWTVVSGDDAVRGGVVIDGRDVEEGGARLQYFILDSELHGEEIRTRASREGRLVL